MYSPPPGRALTALLCAVSAILPCTAEYTAKNTSVTPGFTLLAGVDSVPVPVSVAPDQVWQGIDGSWNGFSLRVGSQKRRASVLASTNSQQTWVVNQVACVLNDNKTLDKSCEISRGSLLDPNESTTWTTQGYYGLWTGRNLNPVNNGNGFFGYDTVSLGMPGEEGPTVQNTTIATIITSNFWLGYIGLHPKQTNFSKDIAPAPSYMTQLFEQGSIPSLSFGYTAGSRYRDPVYLASLTLGGYDSSRFIPNNSSFVFAPDNDRDLVVNVESITASSSTSGEDGFDPDYSLLPSADVTVLIDSTVAEIWLPISACELFEKRFGLVYDNVTELYLVDDKLHDSLVAQNISIKFTLSQRFSTNERVQITLPYAALDLEATPPYRRLNETTRYFPIRRGKDPTQWVLGRTFLQEAYLSVDWERERFSVYPVDWKFGVPATLVPIVSPIYGEVYVVVPDDTGLSTGAIAGIATGAALAAILLAGVVGWWFWRRRQKAAKSRYEAMAGTLRNGSPSGTDEPPLTPLAEKVTNVFPKAELPGDSARQSTSEKEKGGFGLYEVDNTERPVYEMMGDVPSTPEAGGRQLSEKESMMVREKKINGVDPNSTNESLVSPEAIARPAVVLRLDDIAMVEERLPAGVSPITPRTPRDGAQLEAGDTFFQPISDAGGRGRELGMEAGLVSPISPMFPPIEERRRFSYES